MKNPAHQITGGRKAFAAIIKHAFTTRITSPVIRYSHAKGFHVETAGLPADRDVLWSRPAIKGAHDCDRNITAGQYPQIRSLILQSKKPAENARRA